MKRASDPPSREITPETLFFGRRDFLKNAVRSAGTAAVFGTGLLTLVGNAPPPDTPLAKPLDIQPNSAAAPELSKGLENEPLTPYQAVTTYNNFYEFGLDKDDPARNAHTLRPRPWSIAVEGLVAEPGVIDIETLLKWFPTEERVYRMRCVEAWSMVIPWSGFALGALIKRLEPTSQAKYIEFETLKDPVQMPGQRAPVLQWPYIEGLRLDEAMHPLTILSTGVYGRELPNQMGAPLRLVVPWKYGFKGVKSIVKIRFTDTLPRNTWAVAAPREYGFFANVNPEVDHPRWSQATERRIGEFGRRPTLPFNGYAEEVASLYAGIDLRRNF